MHKVNEVTDSASCWNKARDNERLFILLERDRVAPAVIRYWAAERVRLGYNDAADHQIAEALQCADAMEQCQANG